MKTKVLTFLILIALFSSCKMNSDTEKVSYDSMHFVRQGGGQIDFKMYPTDNSDSIKVIVSKYNFRDTTLQIMLDNNADNNAAFSSFYNTINNETKIDGDLKQSTLATGTWAHIYFISGSEETEVTNTELIDLLLQFEQLTKSMIK